MTPARALLGLLFVSGGSARRSPPASPTAFLPQSTHLVFDQEVLFDQDEVERRVALETLQSLRPPRQPIMALGEVLSSEVQPWDDVDSIPSHQWKTFDMNRKFSSLLRGLCPQRPAESVLLLRLLFDEHKIGRAENGGRDNPRGTRPLTVGEICENWDDLVRDRCIARWAVEEDIARSDAAAVEAMMCEIDAKVLGITERWLRDDISMFSDSIHFHPQVNAAMTELIRGRCVNGGGATMILRSSSPLAHPNLRDTTVRLLESELQIANVLLDAGEASDEGNLPFGREDALTLVVVNSVSEIESVIRRAPGNQAAYISSFWNPLVWLCGILDPGESSLYFCEWSRRHSTFLERATAKANGKINFLTAEELLRRCPVAAEAKPSAAPAAIFGSEYIFGTIDSSGSASALPNDSDQDDC